MSRGIFEKGKEALKGIFPCRALPFDTLFGYFRQTISHHNRAVELIADMGEKLSGDYLFDIVYLRRSYVELHDTLSDSLEGFTLLTRNRYPQLRNVLSAIDREIRRLLYDETHSSGSPVKWYEEIEWHMSHEVGGKNANLAEIRNRLPLEVPAAFVITTTAFDEFMKYNGLDEARLALEGNDGDEKKRLQAMRARILQGAIPAAVEKAVAEALEKMKARCGGRSSLAVRSSAEGEDGEFSYAGQFETFLNVPLETGSVLQAYRQVIASLFSEKSVVYQQQFGSDRGKMKMAVGCLCMVEAAASGVVYSTDPGGSNSVLVNAAWGLGEALVEGQAGYDQYEVSRGEGFRIISRKPGKKSTMVAGSAEGGVSTVPVSVEMVDKETLSDEQVRRLADHALQIERYFRKPQDIEWAMDGSGKIFILQARPLRISGNKEESRSEPITVDARILMQGDGTVVQRGAGAGRVFIVNQMEELDNFPQGAVLVARHDSSDFIRIMPYAAAIITDGGSPASHMAALCREFRLPAVVNTGTATRTLVHGQEITLLADDSGVMTVFEGTRGELLTREASSEDMERLHEFRKKRYVLRYISPLHLIDPLMDNFAPGGCSTMHDILRFIHEKSVMALVDNALRGARNSRAAKLELPVPAGIVVVDIGGGLHNGVQKGAVTFDEVASVPFRALLKGLVYPGAWQSEAVALSAHDFMSSMIRMPDITYGSGDFAGNNVALISDDYVNLSIRFGYHFTVIDCYCSEMTGNNHLYFRFSGGATDMVKRSRRVRLIELILKEYGFNTQIKGDLLVGRIANVETQEMQDILEMTGRLLAYTRQLDAMLQNDSDVEGYAKKFLHEG